MAENLIFDNLWQKAGADEQTLAKELANFELPVIDVVFRMLGYDHATLESLGRLQDLTLIQVYLDRETGLVYYFMPPLVKKLLERRGLLEEMAAQFHEQAGRYHYYMFREVMRGSTSELEAAFGHFYRVKNRERSEELGRGLSGFYYRHAFYAEALRVCQGVEELYRDQLPWWCCNRIGLIGLSIGSYDLALDYFQRGMKILESTANPTDEDLKKKGATLNNINQIYISRGDLGTALRYLEQSLQISRQIGDKSGEGVTLSNIGKIYYARGDLDIALGYLEQSLKIRRQIGDKSSEGMTLNNISQVYYARGDLDTALRYLEQSLKISRQIGDIVQEAITCFNMAPIFEQTGKIEKAIQLVERTVEIETFMQSPYLESDTRYLMELKKKVTGDKKEGS